MKSVKTVLKFNNRNKIKILKNNNIIAVLNSVGMKVFYNLSKDENISKNAKRKIARYGFLGDTEIHPEKFRMGVPESIKRVRNRGTKLSDKNKSVITTTKINKQKIEVKNFQKAREEINPKDESILNILLLNHIAGKFKKKDF